MFFTRGEIRFPDELAGALAPGDDQRPRLAPALAKLWERLAKRRGIVEEGETHYAFQRAEAEAYAAYYLPANALKTALVMEELYLLGIDPMEHEATWLDCGTGPGTAYWGLAWWANARGKNLRFHGWDQSPVFAELASRLARKSPFPPSASFLGDRKENPLSLIRKFSPTHLSFVNSVAEIFPDPARRLEEMKKILAALHKLARADGRARYLLLIEPGSRESSRELAALKDQLKSDAQVLLPCLDQRPCGALAKAQDWCHEEVACEFPAWLNELGATAGLRKESVLFSYALLQVGGPPRALGGWRMVSQRLERKGQVECWLCAPTGKVFARAQRSKANDSSGLVFDANRGDLWEPPRLGEKGDVEEGRAKEIARKTIFLST